MTAYPYEIRCKTFATSFKNKRKKKKEIEEKKKKKGKTDKSLIYWARFICSSCPYVDHGHVAVHGCPVESGPPATREVRIGAALQLRPWPQSKKKKKNKEEHRRIRKKKERKRRKMMSIGKHDVLI